MWYVLLTALLVTLCHAPPSKVACDYSSGSGDIRTMTNLSKMGISQVEDTDCIQITPTAPQAGDQVTVTFTCGGNGYTQGLAHVKKTNGDDSSLTANSGTSKCSGARVEWSGGLGSSVELTWTPSDAGEYEIVAVAGRWGGLRREVMTVDVAGTNK